MPLHIISDALTPVPNRRDQERVKKKIEWLWEFRLTIAHRQLGGNLAGYLKRRLGDYRIIYTYDLDSDDMTVYMVGLRDTIYKDFRP